MLSIASASLLLAFSCVCAGSEVEIDTAQLGARLAFPRIEDVPPLLPIVNPFLWIRWHEGYKPSSAEVPVNSSHAGREEISFFAIPSVAWLHVTPGFATTPAKLVVSVDPLITDSAGEIVISAPGSKWEPVYIRVVAHMTRVDSEVAAAVNAASFSAGISPGAVITLFGSHLGPDDLVPAGLVDGGYQIEVAETSFKLDSMPCPILYVSARQSSIIIPYGIQPGKHTLEIANTYGGESYAGAASLDIAQVAPGTFTLLMNGRGPAVALNEDYSLNTAANPAKRGSWVMFYATGLGELESRPLMDGAPEDRAVRHAIVPSATVGTNSAFVYYAGSAPGFVSAVSQVNIQIPPDAPSGAVELKLVSGTTSSQDGVTIFVK